MVLNECMVKLIDARIGADGVNYSNLGSAVRTQFLDVNDNISFLEERKQQLIEKLNKANKPVKYLEMLKQLYLSEMKLKEYFIANNNRNTSVFIGNRIDLLMEDIQDLEKKFNL